MDKCIFTAILLISEMRGLCGIRRLGDQEGLDLFPSETSRFEFLLSASANCLYFNFVLKNEHFDALLSGSSKCNK